MTNSSQNIITDEIYQMMTCNTPINDTMNPQFLEKKQSIQQYDDAHDRYQTSYECLLTQITDITRTRSKASVR